MYRFIHVFIGVLLLSSTSLADNLNFSLHKLNSELKGPTLLVFGGIQGDEPGGFNAASLLVTNYKVSKGNVWVVPNLNFESIIKRSRGINGDLNRKFSKLKANDPEYDLIQKVKAIILDSSVDMILNLHDGSGFYSKKYINKKRNPNRWGQSIVIDQESIGDSPMKRMGEVARSVITKTNEKIPDKDHHYSIHNTKTSNGDKEMEKTLTYFAIQNGKPAVGIEASKTFLTHERAWFHLQVLETYMETLDIEFKRNFELTRAAVKKTIDENVKVALYKNRIYLDMANARNRLRYVPLKKDTPIEFSSTNPLVAVVRHKNQLRVRYGNRGLTRLSPQFFEYDTSLKQVRFQVDGESRVAEIGSAIKVENRFLVEPQTGYRVNVIGFRKSGVKNESGISISRQDIIKRFSVDRRGRFFRVEFYREKKFSGMVLVKFTDPKLAQANNQETPDSGKKPKT